MDLYRGVLKADTPGRLIIPQNLIFIYNNFSRNLSLQVFEKQSHTTQGIASLRSQ
jgi:hypothetical protein